MSSILILGNPNCGKSLLFNRLTGHKNKVSNFPGVTVELATGALQESPEIELIDFPGLYSLSPLTQDEIVAVNALHLKLKDSTVHGILCVLDGTRLARSLAFALQIQNEASKAGKGLIFAINMMDEVFAGGLKIDVAGLEKDVGVSVLAISARTNLEMPRLRKLLERLAREPAPFIPPAVHNVDVKEHRGARARDLASRFGIRSDVLIRKQNKLDAIFLSNGWGGLLFALVMMMFFQAIFSWAAPIMDVFQKIVVWMGEGVSDLGGPGVVHDFLKDALFGGFGSFLVFVPQIFILTLIIGFLEDSGYLARAAVICHRPLSFLGLSGKSFVPLLTGHACAIPAIMSARMIESPRKRWLTILITPLMSCSARLPVYGLLISAVVAKRTILGGLIGLQGAAFFALYALGIIVGLVLSAILSRRKMQITQDIPFIIELPPYRWPQWLTLFKYAFERSSSFVMRAGPVIFLVTVTVWFLGYFPGGAGHLQTSYLAYAGKWIAPLFAPLGLDWRFTVAILASFLAREVFVGTLGTLYGIDGATDDFRALSEKLHAEGMTLATGAAILVFFVLAMQCASTLAVMRKETGSSKMPIYVFVGYSLLAYVSAYVTYGLFSLFAW